MTVHVEQVFTGNMLRNYHYCLSNSDGKAWIIDPWDAKFWINYLQENNLNLVSILNTHEHYDHVKGNKKLVQKTGCEVWAHQNADGKIEGVDRYLYAGEKIFLDDQHFLKILDTPGHTFAHLCFVLMDGEKEQALFSGDTLFHAGVGNCHNGGDPEVLYETVSRQLQTLPENLVIYPGHEYMGNNLKFTLDREPSNQDAKEMLSYWEQKISKKENPQATIADEKKVNTFFRLNESTVIENLDGDTSDEKQVFLRLREKRNKW